MVVCALLFDACKKEELEIERAQSQEVFSNTISLIWNQNDFETKKDVEVGLTWCFSFLGADLPIGGIQQALVWDSHNVINLDLRELGFNSLALMEISKLVEFFKESEAYKLHGAADVGRFVAVVFNNSHNYYKIVGMPTHLNEFNKPFIYLKKKAAIIESAVAFGERIIELPRTSKSIERMGYVAHELEGSISKNTQVIKEFEVMDVMKNGQLRFGVYNVNGKLIQGADPNLSSAGKPAKCLWCHETRIQIGFAAQTAVSGFYAPWEFDSIVNSNSETLQLYRNSLKSGIDFEDFKAHTELEKLYIRFMEPSAKRLSQEWGISIDEVNIKLNRLKTHNNLEFPEMGKLFTRTDVEQFAPFHSLPISNDAREVIGTEFNFLK